MSDFYNTIRKTNIAMSWGINTPKNMYNKILSFKVQGFKFKGVIYVYLKNDLFEVVFVNRFWNIKNKMSWVYLEDFIERVDKYVEKGCSDEEYKKKVSESAILI